MKIRFTIILFLMLLSALCGAQSIVAAEYFFDDDPGFGNGIALSIGTAADSVNFNAGINTSNLSIGIHRVFIRTKSSTGKWSMYCKAIQITPKIIAAEYFFDKDPGRGNGTAINIGTVADSVNFNATIITTNLSIGKHNVYFRTKNSQGTWSQYCKPILITPKIIAAEYFFDKDPGRGNGTALNIGVAADSVNFNASINTTNLSIGKHTVYFRTKNSQGSWSLYSKPISITPQIIEAEYFFDKDPGQGNGIAFAINPSADSVNVNASINTANLTAGKHKLYIRSKNSQGVWSLYIQPIEVTPQIIAAEYFVDTDPGQGNATVIPIVSPSDSVNISASLPIGNATPGQHKLCIRTLSSAGNWSFYNTINFTICDSIGTPTQITGDTLAAACIHQNGLSYSIDTVFNATYYVWNLPSGASIQNGDSTTSVTVNYSPYSSSGNVTVAGAYGACIGPSAALAVQFNPIPVAEICRATIDSAGQKTLIEWQKPIQSYVSGYVIFRDSSGTFINLDTIANTAYSSYLDTGSHPTIQAEKYKIAVLDSCGNIGDISMPFEHQTIRLNGSIQAGGIAKLYWNDYMGINDPQRYFNLLRDPSGSGPFNDTIAKNIMPFNSLIASDPTSAAYPLCRYVVEMVYNSNCTPSQRLLASRSTSRSNIKNKTSLFDSTNVGIGKAEFEKFDFKVFPNPSKGAINIELSGSNTSYTLKVIDLLGRKTMPESKVLITRNKVQFNLKLDAIQPGVYFILIENEKSEKRLAKLIIE